jgi:hypothetical protein
MIEFKQRLRRDHSGYDDDCQRSFGCVFIKLGMFPTLAVAEANIFLYVLMD